MRSMSTNLTERVEVMVERAAVKVGRVSEKVRVVETGVAAMVKGRVGVIVRSLLVSLNNLVCTAHTTTSLASPCGKSFARCPELVRLDEGLAHHHEAL